jgi:anti-sigma regulatory factor (Ser/Thr protein kinase)
MIEIPEILSLFGERSVKEAWEPVLAQFPGQILTILDSYPFAESAMATQLDFIPSLILVSADLYAIRGTELIKYLHENYPYAEILVLASMDTPSIPLWSLIADKVRHLAVVDPIEESRKFLLLLKTMAANEPWDLMSYLNADADLKEFQLSECSQKEDVIHQIENLVIGQAPDLNILRQKGILLADEMIENAIQAAPGGAGGQKGVLVRAGFDGEQLAIQVIDNWGTLTPEKALEHLARHQDGHISAGHTGGRGLFILWKFFDHFHVNITLGEKTAVGGQICRKSTSIEGRARGFNIFQLPSSARPNASNQCRFGRRTMTYA